jgi:hypothetical protein
MHKPSRMRSLPAALALAVALSFVGCGGESNSSIVAHATQQATGPKGVELSKSQLIEKADLICRRMNVEFAAHEPRSQSIDESARIVPHRVSVEQRVLAELRQLVPPSSIASDLQRVIAFRNTLARELAELAQVAERRDTAEFHRLAASKARVHSELLAAADGAGFKQCGQTGQPAQRN